jgi:hypothetical protein
MPFDFILKQTKPDVVKNFMVVRGCQIPVAMIRNHRARRYLLRLLGMDNSAVALLRMASISSRAVFIIFGYVSPVD